MASSWVIDSASLGPPVAVRLARPTRPRRPPSYLPPLMRMPCVRVDGQTVRCREGKTTQAFVGYTDVVAAGEGSGCARRPDGSWWCAGLGPGYFIDGVDPGVFQPRPSEVQALRGAKQVAFSGGHHGCTITGEGGVACWGFNEEGQLGVETTKGCYYMRRSVPCATTPQNVSGVSDALELALSSLGSCARTARGEVVCWGKVARADASEPTACPSDETTTHCLPPPPKRIAGLSGVVGIVASDYFVCALLDDGRVACWGSNASGVMGAGFNGPLSRTPVVVEGLDDVVRIAAGPANLCAIKSNGHVICWGSGRSGYLHQPAAAYEVEGLDDAIELSDAGVRTCALRTNAQIVCWPTNPPTAPGQTERRAMAEPLPPWW